jgi:hypothetical protein
MLDDAIGRLPAKYRAPFVLCYLQGMSNAEAARHLGCPLGTIATWLSRARKRLRARLANQGLGLPAALAAVTVPPALLAGTVRAALLVAGEAVRARALPAKFPLIWKGVWNVVLTHKSRILMMAFLVCGAASAGIGTLAYRAPAGEPRADDEAVPPSRPKEAVRTTTSPLGPPDEIDKGPATVRTANFVVKARTERIARLVAGAAERQRTEQAFRWLGNELPTWREPCPVEVKVDGSSGSATSFRFEHGKVSHMQMHLEDSLDRILANAVPRQVTHTIFAHTLGESQPRWPSDGAAKMAEDEQEQHRQEKIMRQLANAGKIIPLSRLLQLNDYPKEIVAYYAQSYSLTRFLVEECRDRQTFVPFVRAGSSQGWDQALRRYYGYSGVQELEKRWLDYVRATERKSGERGDKRPLAVGPAPSTALAVLTNANHIQLRLPVVFYEPVTTYLKGSEEEGDRAVTSYRQSYREQKVYLEKKRTQAFDTAGKAIDARTLAQLLKKETPVLFSADGRKVDPFHLQLVKEGTMILVSPPAPQAPPPAVSAEPVTEPPPPAPRQN